MITEKAFAKINLNLKIAGVRPDGYHAVDMVMQTVGFHDTLQLELLAEPRIELHSNYPEMDNESNLIWKAARLLQSRYQVKQGVKITLKKRIFVAAGLAGGSTDGAATLRGCNRLWKLQLSNEELEKLAAELGSDIPFLIQGGTVRATGRGEVLEHYPDEPKKLVVLAKPRDIAISTKWAYQSYDRLPSDLPRDTTENVLELVAFPKYPVLAEMKQLAQKAGAQKALMSGSGPTMYALCNDVEQVRAVVKVWQKFNVDICETEFQERMQ